MDKLKKNGLLVLIYATMILLCFGVVLVVNELCSPTQDMKKTTEIISNDNAIDQEDSQESETEGHWNLQTEGSKEIPEKSPIKHPTGEETEVDKEIEEQQEEYKPPVIVIISDIHYFSPVLTDYGKAFDVMLMNEDGKVVNYIPQLMDAFTAEMETFQPSAVIISGDLTMNGEKACHEELAKKLEILEEKGVKVLVIPGNHDINNQMSASYFGEQMNLADTVNPQEFYEIYRQFGYDQAESRDKSSLSYVYELDKKNWLLMLDSAQYEPVNKVGGRIKKETLEWMDKRLAEAKEREVTVIAIAHHNLLRESIRYTEDCTLENSQEVIELLESYRIPLYISGHLHLQRSKKYKLEPGESNQIYHINEIVANSFAIPPCQYGILKWSADDRLVYTTKETDVESWAKIEGSSDENLLQFKSYGTKFLTQVISSQIYNQIHYLPEAEMKKMAELYGKINRAYCEGIPIDAQEIQSGYAYYLWQRYLPDSKFLFQIDEMLRDSRYDHNLWEYELDKTE